MLKTQKRILSVLPLILFCGLFFYSLTNSTTMTRLYVGTSYYLMLGLCVLWLYQLVIFLRHLHFSPKAFLKSYWPGIILALVLTGMIFATVPVHFKILGDETNLLSVSQAMFYNRDANLVSMASYLNGEFQIIDTAIPNRPLLFPFATAVLHSIFGYHYQNAFILNFLVMFVFLAGVYVAVRKTCDPPAAVAAMVLILSYPVLSLYATSGGYDLFSTFFFALVLTLFYHLLKSPHSDRLALLWTSLLMFSNIRYESCIFMAILIVAAFKSIRLKHFTVRAYVYLLTPLLSLPYIWQRILSQGTYENPPGVPLFSMQSFFKHAKIFIQNFMNLNFELPYAGMLNLAAALIIGCLLILVLTKKIQLAPFQKYFVAIVLLCMGVILVIVLSHHFGRYDRPTQARLFIHFSMFCALTPIFLKVCCPSWLRSRSLLAASIVVFLLYHPIAGQHTFINSLVITRVHQSSLKFLKNHSDQNLLVVTSYAGQFTPLNYGAVTIDYANSHRQKIMSAFKRHQYSRVIVLQEIAYATRAPRWPNQRLDSRFKLKPLKEIQVARDRYLRISELLR